MQVLDGIKDVPGFHINDREGLKGTAHPKMEMQSLNQKTVKRLVLDIKCCR